MLTKEDKTFLLQLARKSIEYYLDTGNTLELSPDKVKSENLIKIGACFVTLKKGEELRGCIGTLEAHRPLFQDVIENSLASAFGDPRFYPLTKEELKEVKISISVLTEPKEFPVKDYEDLLVKLEKGKHGLILKQGFAQATFLPAVWEQLPDKIMFLEHLSMKAGLTPDGWKDPKTKFFVYEAIEFSE
ncbi:AmmeMemoRadiSam system protein A [Candidatus Woesearchaeota archaeon]|nr:AmmeMemoRadiSam system protein A [Candidatus Woesearchaeota archaeon]